MHLVLAERSRADIAFTIDKPEGPITGQTTGKKLYPRSGSGLLWHDGNRWTLSTITFKGNWAKADGTEGSRTGSAWFSDPLGDIPADVEDGDEPFPSELPEWLLRDLAAIVARFNGEAEQLHEDTEAVQEPQTQRPEDILLSVPQEAASGHVWQFTGRRAPDGDPIMIVPGFTRMSIPLSRLVSQFGPLIARHDVEYSLCEAYYGVGDGTAEYCVRAEGHPEVHEDKVGHSHLVSNRAR